MPLEEMNLPCESVRTFRWNKFNNQFVGQQQGMINTSMVGANASDRLAENLFAQEVISSTGS